MADPNEIVGPPQAPHPWEADPNVIDNYERALPIAEMAKNYRETGAMAKNAAIASQHYAKLAQRGGLTQDEATHLARYRMQKFGMPNVPRGARAPAPTPEQINAHRDEFLKADPARRLQMLAEDKASVERGHEAYFDSLVGPGPAAQPAQAAKPSGPTPQDIEAARKIVDQQKARRVASR